MPTSFHITAHTALGPLTVVRTTPESAMDKARELMREVKVTITGSDGIEHSPDDFAAIFLKDQTDADRI